MFKTLAATQQAETAAISEVGFHGFGPSDRRAGGSTQLLQARNGTWALTNPFAHFIFPGSPAPTMLGQVSTRNKKYSETGWAILMGQYLEGPRSRPIRGFFFFIFKKKLKFQKYMSVLENFKNILRSPYRGLQGSNVIFFLQICNEVPGEKKRGGSVAPPTGDRPCRPPQGRQASGPARGAGRPSCGRQGGLSPPHGRPGQAAYIRPPPSFPPHLTSKNPQKIQKKERGEEKGSGEALPNSALVIYR